MEPKSSQGERSTAHEQKGGMSYHLSCFLFFILSMYSFKPLSNLLLLNEWD